MQVVKAANGDSICPDFAGMHFFLYCLPWHSKLVACAKWYRHCVMPCYNQDAHVFTRLVSVCRTITLRKDKFDEREEDFYEALYTQSQAQFATYIASGTVVNNYAHIFDLLIRLRQVYR